MPNDAVKKEFEAAIASNNPQETRSALQKIFFNMVELNITTTVVNSGPEEISTKINLLDGDIQTSIHSKFAPDPEKVAAFHKEQVNKAEQIIERNVDTMKNLVSTLIGLFP